MTETIDRQITGAVGQPDASAITSPLQPEAGEEAMPFKYNMDFRPQGNQGNEAGAVARQRARIKQLEKVGRGILLDKPVTTDVVILTPSKGAVLFELVRPGEPIPEWDMVPNARVDISRPAPSGVFTPFEPTGRSYSIKVDANKTE